jgi:hypothetical protein
MALGGGTIVDGMWGCGGGVMSDISMATELNAHIRSGEVMKCSNLIV